MRTPPKDLTPLEDKRTLIEDRITKIRLAEKYTEIHWQQQSESGSLESRALKCSDRPTGAFITALQNLRRFALRVAGLPESLERTFDIAAISYHYSDDDGVDERGEGMRSDLEVTITAEREVAGYDKPVVLKLPPTTFLGEAMEALNRVSEQAAAYVAGDRVSDQMNLFEDDYEAAA